MPKVFVYGTLRKGRGNNRLLEDTVFIGKGKTTNKYHLTAGGLPYVSKSKSTSQVVGEVYEVTDQQLKRLDMLEGYDPNNHNGSWYKREIIDITLDDGNKEKAALYFNDDEGNSIIYNGDYCNPITKKN